MSFQPPFAPLKTELYKNKAILTVWLETVLPKIDFS
jgi:hypothetical protein